MEQNNYSIKHQKGKHLSLATRVQIQMLYEQNYSAYKIAQIIGCASNTVRNELKRGEFLLKKSNKIVYRAKKGQEVYSQHRENCKNKYKAVKCFAFLKYIVECVKCGYKKWSIDASVGYAKRHALFHPSQMLSTKTIYNYIDLNLLELTNFDLPEKLQRQYKKAQEKKNKRVLGESIEDRPAEIDTRQEFGHWEIDTVVGEKHSKGEVLMSLVERKTNQYLAVKIAKKDATSVMQAIAQLRNTYGTKFNQVFKSITSDNGSEFADLHTLKDSDGIAVFFTHPYSSWERAINERHNRTIRRFIKKGVPISHYSDEQIEFVQQWINSLPRKIFDYKTSD